MEREKASLESEIQDCLGIIGISLLSDWDLLTFVYRHGPSLTTTDHISKLVGYEKNSRRCSARSAGTRNAYRTCGGPRRARLYRMSTSKDAQHRGYLQQVIALSESRDGRLLVVRLLKPVGRNSGENKLSMEKKGNWLCLKTT
jgi:hypothetical protein